MTWRSGLVWSVLVFAAGAARAETILFIDDEDVLYRSGTRKVVQQMEKSTDNPVITPDNPELPWEKSIQWVSAYRDPQSGKFQIWYQAYSGKGAEDKSLKSVVAYAESEDGVHWVKPKLKLFPYVARGFDVKETNIVLVGAANGYGDRYSNSVVVNPQETDPAKRYKMIYYDWTGKADAEGYAGINAAYSPDGIRWTKERANVLQKMSFGAKTMQPPFEDESVYFHLKNPDGREWRQWRVPASLSDALDALWDARLQKYVIYGKMWINGPDGGINWKHGMGRSESADFTHWTRPQLLIYPDENDPSELEFHTSPVFIYNGMYLSLNQLFTRENGTIDNELMSSRDGLKWNRTFARQSVIPRGGEKAFDSGFVLTNGNPITVGDELWFYYGGNRGLVRFPNPPDKNASRKTTEWGSGIGLAKMKRDRFVAVQPDPRIALRNWNPNDPEKKPEPPANTLGQVTLKPRDLTGKKELLVNARTNEGGAVRVEILNEDGYRLHGFTKDDAVPLSGDKLDFAAAWKEKSLADLQPGKYQIRVFLDNAALFALTLK